MWNSGQQYKHDTERPRRERKHKRVKIIRNVTANGANLGLAWGWWFAEGYSEGLRVNRWRE
jgi:hypothetical protein